MASWGCYTYYGIWDKSEKRDLVDEVLRRMKKIKLFHVEH